MPQRKCHITTNTRLPRDFPIRQSQNGLIKLSEHGTERPTHELSHIIKKYLNRTSRYRLRTYNPSMLR